MSHVVECPIGFIFLCNLGWQDLCAKTYEKCSTLSIFNCFRPFSQVFVEVKECIISEMLEMIKVLHVVVCPMLFFSGGLMI